MSISKKNIFKTKILKLKKKLTSNKNTFLKIDFQEKLYSFFFFLFFLKNYQFHNIIIIKISLLSEFNLVILKSTMSSNIIKNAYVSDNPPYVLTTFCNTTCIKILP